MPRIACQPLHAAAGTFVGGLPLHAGLANTADDDRLGKLIGHAVVKTGGAAGLGIRNHVVGDAWRTRLIQRPR
jgi:hypothetical protein